MPAPLLALALALQPVDRAPTDVVLDVPGPPEPVPADSLEPPVPTDSPPPNDPDIAPVSPAPAPPPADPPVSAPAPKTSQPSHAPTPKNNKFLDALEVFPYGWIRTDATYYSAADEGYSNLSLAGARLGGGVRAGPVTAFATIEAGQDKGPRLVDAFVLWDVVARLRLRAGQFKAPFGYRFNVPDLVDELPRAPLSLQAATPGRQVGVEAAYDFWRWADVSVAVFSGIGQNREANNTKVALAGKLQVRPLTFTKRGPQLILNASVFAYHKTNGFSPTVDTALGFEFIHGVPAAGPARRVTAGGGLFWRFLSARGEFFYTRDSRERDTDGDPFTPGDPLPPMIGSGGYAQIGAVVTGQTKDPNTLLPLLKSRRVRDSAVELSARFDSFRLGARDVRGNGVQAVTAGVNWVLLQHLRVFAAFNYQALDARIPEIPGASSWGFHGGVAGYFLRGAGRGD